jgi:hypothetical protein
MSQFVLVDGPDGLLNARAVGDLSLSLFAQPVALRWMVNPRLVGMPRAPFTIAIRLAEPVFTTSEKFRLANEGEWQDIEVVGLPIDEQSDCPGYFVTPHGPAPASLSPRAAAIDRLRRSGLTTGWPNLPGAMPNPGSEINWVGPDPARYVDMLTQSDVLRGVCRMLKLVIPAEKQLDFEFHEQAMQVPKPELLLTRQPVSFGTAATSKGNWRPFGVLMLAVATDPFAAIALGFGMTTTLIAKGTAVRISFPHKFPGMGPIVHIADVVWPEHTGDPLPPVQDLRATRESYTPPQRVDAVSMETIGIRWKRPLNAQYMADEPPNYTVSYGVARMGAVGENPKILLTKRGEPNHPEVRGWHAYVAGLTDKTDDIVFYDHLRREQGPGTPDPRGHPSTYLVAAQDIFGRWSKWEKVTYTSQDESPQIPRVQHVEVTPEGIVTVDFSWDWSARSPEFIELRGGFADSPNTLISERIQFGGNPNATPIQNNVFALNPARERVAFGSQQDKAGASNPGVRYYQFRTVLTPDTQGKPWRAFQVQARGQCHLHEKETPGFNVSPFGDPLQTRLYDRSLPPPLSLPQQPEAPLWASLRDSAGVSRIVLKWNKVPRALGYILYEATESTLRGPGAAIDPSISFTDRLRELRRENFKAKRFAFQRVNKELILPQRDQISHEVSLPRGSGVIHIYAVTVLQDNQKESEFPASSSHYFAVAVPRLVKPNPPSLEANAALDTPAGVKLIIRPGAGIATRHVEVYRTTRPENSVSVDRMGPPIARLPLIDPETPFVDSKVPPWRTVWYRAIAWPADDPQHGVIKARSDASSPVSIAVPSNGAPRIVDLKVHKARSSETELRISWMSDAPLHLTPLGSHDAAVEIWREGAGLPTAITRRLDQIQVATAPETLPPAPDGEIFRVGGPKSYRLHARLPRPEALSLLLNVKMIDPFGRIGSANVEVLHPALEQPPQLSPITFTSSESVEGLEGLRAAWEIMSPLFRGMLAQYRMLIRVEVITFDLTGEGPPDVKSVEVTLGLDQLMATSPQIDLAPFVHLQHVPGTRQFFVQSADPLGRVTVRLTDPWGRSATSSAGRDFLEGMGITTIPEEPKPVEVPDVIGSSVLDARQKLRELGLVPIDGNTFFSPLTAIVVSQKPAPPSVVPVGKAVEIVAQDAL